MKLTSLADWLAESGLRNLPLEEMVDGFSRRLNDMGVPVARTFVGMNTLHPLVRARSLIWDRITGRYSTELAKMIEITPAPLTLSGMNDV